MRPAARRASTRLRERYDCLSFGRLSKLSGLSTLATNARKTRQRAAGARLEHGYAIVLRKSIAKEPLTCRPMVNQVAMDSGVARLCTTLCSRFVRGPVRGPVRGLFEALYEALYEAFVRAFVRSLFEAVY